MLTIIERYLPRLTMLFGVFLGCILVSLFADEFWFQRPHQEMSWDGMNNHTLFDGLSED